MSKKIKFKTNIIERYFKKETLKQIAESENCSATAIMNCLKRTGIPRRKQGFQKGKNHFNYKDGRWSDNSIKYQKEYSKKYYQKNKEHIKKQVEKWRKEHLEHCKKYLREKRKNNPQFCLNKNISTAIRRALKNKKAGRKWETLVDYTIIDLIKHLENLFDNKMIWANYGSYWHLDHIKPKSLFQYKTAEDEEFKQCWSLNNLQPLERIANLKKSNHYEQLKSPFRRQNRKWKAGIR